MCYYQKYVGNIFASKLNIFIWKDVLLISVWTLFTFQKAVSQMNFE